MSSIGSNYLGQYATELQVPPISGSVSATFAVTDSAVVARQVFRAVAPQDGVSLGSFYAGQYSALNLTQQAAWLATAEDIVARQTFKGDVAAAFALLLEAASGRQAFSGAIAAAFATEEDAAGREVFRGDASATFVPTQAAATNVPVSHAIGTGGEHYRSPRRWPVPLVHGRGAAAFLAPTIEATGRVLLVPVVSGAATASFDVVRADVAGDMVPVPAVHGRVRARMRAYADGRVTVDRSRYDAALPTILAEEEALLEEWLMTEAA